MAQIIKKVLTEAILEAIPSLKDHGFSEGDELTLSVDRYTPVTRVTINEAVAEEFPELQDMGFWFSREKDHEYADEIALTVCSYVPAE